MSDDPIATDETAAPQDDASTEAVCTAGPYRCYAHVRTSRPGLRSTPAVVPLGFGPQDLQAAYKIDPNNLPATRPTIAIVDAYGYPAIESDLAAYRTQFGLPPCTIASGCLRVVNQQGLASPLPPLPPANSDWTIETALDVDMASAACPKCNILVVQANDGSDGLFIAQNAAAQLGATVISNSWGGPEDPMATPADTARMEAYFAHPNIAIFVAAGDTGYNNGGMGPSYPATSAHVIAVGGTTLARDTSARGWTETAWSNGGSACSLSIPKPAYQTASPCPFKATTDIAAVGDSPGVAVYHTGKGGWITVGGTSASAPIVASIFAATGNGMQTSGAFIAANVGKLYDVTSGNNGMCGTSTLLCNAAVGWDGPTGYGTPNAKALAPPVVPVEVPKDEPDMESIAGGCSTGGGAGAGVFLAIALLGLRRRR